jgi:hypothetical protein
VCTALSWHAMPRRSVALAALVPSVVVVCAASLNARAGASNSTALAESGHVQQGSSSHVSGGSAPHALPGVPDVELKQAHVVFRCVFVCFHRNNGPAL